MRLTLRTLMAYLDDMLEPSQAREIGEKIAESPYASGLINRIREVMRRRRLTAPELLSSNAGLDPNLVAEYLDNTLPAEQVAQVEEVCLKSDVHLAEVAAAHQILTLVLGEPVEIDPNSRRRMYALGPMPKEAQKKKRAKEEKEFEAATPKQPMPAVAPVSETTEDSFSSSIPDYLKTKSTFSRMLPYLIVGLVAAIWIGMVVYDPSLFPGQKSEDPATAQQKTTETAGELLAQNEPKAPGNQPVPGEQKQPEIATQLDPPPPLDDGESGPESLIENKPPVNVDVNLPNVGPDKNPPEPMPNEVAVAPKEEEPKVAPPFPENPVDPAFPVITYQSPSGVLLHFEEKPEQPGWYVTPRKSRLQPNTRLLVPAPYTTRINTAEGQTEVTLRSGTAVRLFSAEEAKPAAKYGWELQQGRLIITNQNKPAGPDAAMETVALALKVHGELWRLEFLTSDTRCGIEVMPRLPEQPDQVFGRNGYTGGLYVTKGAVRFADGSGKVQVINERQWSSITPADRVAAAGPASVVTLSETPEWMDTALPDISPSLEKIALKYEAEFDLRRPVAVNIPPLVKSDDPMMAGFAVETLAASRNISELAMALRAQYAEPREAAVLGIRRWLPLSPDNGKKLSSVLDDKFYKDEAADVYRLLWGFSEKDADNVVSSEQLVDWLDSDLEVIREMAIGELIRLTGEDYDYKPLNSPRQRRSSVERWREHLQKNLGTLSGE